MNGFELLVFACKRLIRSLSDSPKHHCYITWNADRSQLRDVDNILIFFLFCLAGTWSGSKQFYEFAEGGRGILVTACRRSRLLDCRPSARVEIGRFLQPGISHMQAAWLAWVETEKRKRLGLSIYVSSILGLLEYPSWLLAMHLFYYSLSLLNSILLYFLF